MTQAVGRNFLLGIFDEIAYGSAAGVTVGERGYIRNFGVRGSIAQLIDETLAGYRGLPSSIKGNTDVGGDIPINMAPQSIPKWLKHLFGFQNTDFACARKTTALITGVEVLRAQNTSAAGNGTLAFTFATSLITWSEFGNTPGTGVNISAGGDFTLASANGKQLFIRVTAGGLPGSNQNDTVNVSASSAKSIVFSPKGTVPEGLLLDANYGAEITAANRWIRFLGCRVTQGKFSFSPAGFLDAVFSIKGANFNNTAGAALDASLDDYGHTAFSMFSAAIEEGGAAFATALSVDLTVDNDADDSLFTISGGGSRGAMPFGFFKAMGNLTALYQDATLINKAIANTASTLKLSWLNGTGDGTAGNEALIIRVPNLVYSATTPAIEGPRGVKQSYEFNSFRPSTAETLVEAELRSTRAVATL